MSGTTFTRAVAARLGMEDAAPADLVAAVTALAAEAQQLHASAPTRFDARVADLVRAGKSMGEAQLEVVREDPNLYSAVLARRSELVDDADLQWRSARGLMAEAIRSRMTKGETWDQACRSFSEEHPELALCAVGKLVATVAT
jgi:hypothetical protein